MHYLYDRDDAFVNTYIQAGHVVLQHGSFSLSRLKKKKKKRLDCGILLLLITNNLNVVIVNMLDRSGVPGIPCATSFDVPRHPRCFRSSFTEDSLVSPPKQPDVHLLFDPAMWRIHLQPPCVMMMQNSMPDTFDER